MQALSADEFAARPAGRLACGGPGWPDYALAATGATVFVLYSVAAGRPLHKETGGW